MKKGKKHILIIEDDPVACDLLTQSLEENSFHVSVTSNAENALSFFTSQKPVIIIIEPNLPGLNGFELIQRLQENEDHQSYIIVLLSSVSNQNDMKKCHSLGIENFIRKPFKNATEAKIAVKRCLDSISIKASAKNKTGGFQDLSLSNGKQIQRIDKRHSLISEDLELWTQYCFIGISDNIKKVLELSKTVAQYDSTNVLITGESGTGKEMIAHIIHYLSNRRDHNFCTVNCGAIPENLLESEFFGHIKGSFTGALDDKKGYFEVSNKGTLFLDEIGDMPFIMQAKLLRAIEAQRIKKIGAQKEFSVDCRIISATNRDINQLIETNEFRVDLLYRLNTVVINIPPLRERKEDISPLLKYFFEFYSRKFRQPMPKISKKTLNILKKYPFPGNVRELRNLVERYMIAHKNGILSPEDFLSGIQLKENNKTHISNLSIEFNEKRLIETALNHAGQNQSKAAELLQISRLALIRRMKKYNIS